MKKEDCFYLGKIVKKYSFKGELILRLDTDEPEIYENLNAVFIDMGKTLVPYFIENSLIQKGNHIRIRFEDINTEEELTELEQELIDRFGSLPAEAINLIYLIEMRILGTELELKSISIDSKRMLVKFHKEVLYSDRELLQNRLGSIVNNAKYPFLFHNKASENLGIKLPFPDNIKKKLKYSKKFLQSLI